MVLLFSRVEPFVQFGTRHHEEKFCEITLNMDQWFRRRCSLNIFLIKSSDNLFVHLSGTIEWNHLYYFGRGNHEEQFCQII